MGDHFHDHPHQKDITDYRQHPREFVLPTEEECRSLEETLLDTRTTKGEIIEILLKILKRDTNIDEEFMMEDLFDTVDLGNLDRRVLGAVIQQAERMGLVKHIGVRKSSVRGHHGLYKSVWQRVR